MDKTDPSTSIYRYMDLPELFALLINQELFFCRSTCLSDNEECKLTEEDFQRLKFDFKQLSSTASSNLDSDYSKLKEYIESTRNELFLSSWSKSKDNYGLWKIYTDNSKFGICIETTYEEINKLINNNKHHVIMANDVKYEKRDFKKLIECINTNDNDNAIKELMNLVIFHKSEHYKYENEYRIVAFNNDVNKGEGIKFSIEPFTFIKSIYLSPFMPEWFKNVLMEIGGMSMSMNTLILFKSIELFKPLTNIAFSKINAKS
jgi:hypothetical protein